MLAVPLRADARARPLESARLVLTPLEPQDAREMWASVEASRAHLEPWLPWVPFTFDLDSTLRYVDSSGSDWDLGRACRMAIRERATRRFVGVIGLESFSHLHENLDLGYWLRLDASGRGYMTEAAGQVVAWAFSLLRAHRIRVAAATDNHASLGVIRRLGFRFEGIAREAERCHGRWLDHAIFSLLSTDSRNV